MDIVYAAREHLHPNFVPLNENYTNVVLETLPHTTKLYPDLTEYDNSIWMIQNGMRKCNTLLSRLLWRYGMIELQSLDGYQINDTLKWKQVSFKRLRWELLEQFKLATYPLSYNFNSHSLCPPILKEAIFLRADSPVTMPCSPITPLTHGHLALKFHT